METGAGTIKVPCMGVLNSGDGWDDGGFHSKIDQILIWYSSNSINGLQFVYRNLDGKTKISPQHGNTSTPSTNFEAILLGGSVLEISGYYDYHRINSLTIVTSSGTYGPYGAKTGLVSGLVSLNPFCFKTQVGFVGFHGRLSRFEGLTAIGVYVDSGSGSKVKQES